MDKNAGTSSGFAGEKNQESTVVSDHNKAAVDYFYEKLSKLNESSGLSLVFNLRETMLDLHQLYQEVMKRGGFYQVTKIGKWDEVASSPNLRSSVSISGAQLQNVYKILLFQYELMYCWKMPEEANIWPDNRSLGIFSCSKGKRKHCESSSPLSTAGQQDKWKGPKMIDTYSTVITSLKSNSKELITDSNVPLKPRTGYLIFLRLETQRLKTIYGEICGSENLREMATDAWRRLPEKEKLAYIEASKMDKERYEKEMDTYNQMQNNKPEKTSQSLFTSSTPTMLHFSTISSQMDDVYHVSLETESVTVGSPDESMVELAFEDMKNAKWVRSLNRPY